MGGGLYDGYEDNGETGSGAINTVCHCRFFISYRRPFAFLPSWLEMYKRLEKGVEYMNELTNTDTRQTNKMKEIGIWG